MAVTLAASYLKELISSNTVVSTINFYMKTFISSGLSGDISLTIPTAGGGAKEGTIIHCVNKDGTYKLTVNYGASLSIELYPGMSAAFIWNGSAWTEHIKVNYRGTNIKLLSSTDYTEYRDTGNGAFETLDNAYWDGANYKFKFNGWAYRTVTNPTTGDWIKYRSTISGTAGNTITWTIAVQYKATTGTFEIDGSPLVSTGLIRGNLEFNSSSVPPTVSAGTREFFGKNKKTDTDTTMALTDMLGACSQNLADWSDTWFRTVMLQDGTFKIVPSFDTGLILTTGNIDATSGIVVDGSGNAKIYYSSGTPTTVGTTIVVFDNTIDTMYAAYITGSGSDGGGNYATGKTSAGAGTYTGGTYNVYFRISTYHGTGTITGINSGPQIAIYSPSPLKCPELLCYGLNQYGVPDNVAANVLYKILGCWFTDNVGNILNDVISYKSGFNKNDNILKANTFSGWGSTDTVIPRFTNWEKMWGSDTILYDNATEGTKVILQKTFKFALNWDASSGADSAIAAGITVNDTERTTSVVSKTNLNEIIGNLAQVSPLGVGNSSATPASFAGVRYKDDVLRPSSTGAGAGTGTTWSRWNFSFEEL